MFDQSDTLAALRKAWDENATLKRENAELRARLDMVSSGTASLLYGTGLMAAPTIP